MSKSEILSALTASGEDKVFRRTINWQKAFDKYKEVTGRQKSMSCGTCYGDILAWLRLN